ncbi:Fic family protein [Nocardia higoensis]|uniref:Fic family protein n=1 Tax=Nocardia higoensis TaxID=228599 RepID=A0ABS0D394_9NOCA|nr:Fic family protein [Nocardia higoensis]MBF6352973.1 Fic family protein [Nocardia higoensis]
MVSAWSSYQPIRPFSDWLITPFNDAQLQLAHAHFVHHFDAATTEIQQALIQQVLRESAAESGAIENLYSLRPGESRTVATQAEGWEQIFDEQADRSTRQTFEDLLAALEYVEKSVNEGRPITSTLICELHAIACRSQRDIDATVLVRGREQIVKKPLALGKFKQTENYVLMRSGEVHRYCPPEQVQAEISTLCDQLNSPEFLAAPAVLQAAYAHFCLAQIHPFDDGNGRVCRVLASLFLLRAYRVPLVVYADRRHLYLQGLESVQNGDFRPLVQDTADRVAATLSELTQIVQARSQPSPDQKLDELLGLIGRHDAVEFANAKEIQSSLQGEFCRMVDERLSRIASESGGSLIFRKNGGSYNYISGDTASVVDQDGLPYDYIPHFFGENSTGRELVLNIEGQDMDIYARAMIGVGLHDSSDGQFPFAIAATRSLYLNNGNRIGAVIKLRYEDCFPAISTSVIARMQTLADAVCADMVSRLNESARTRLRETGRYLQ